MKSTTQAPENEWTQYHCPEDTRDDQAKEMQTSTAKQKY